MRKRNLASSDADGARVLSGLLAFDGDCWSLVYLVDEAVALNCVVES